MIKKPVALPLLATAQAYVMPDEPELTDEQFDALPDAERKRHIDRAVGQAVYQESYDHDPEEDLHQAAERHEWIEKLSRMDDEEYESQSMTEIDKAAAPIMAAAEYADFVANTSHEPIAYGVEIDSRNDANQKLLIAVVLAVNRWEKPPRDEVTAAGISLAIAHVRKEPEVKHPRDIAKEIGVRSQTLFAVRKVALEEIQRLGIGSQLMGAVDEKVGTYNQNEEDETSESSFPE